MIDWFFIVDGDMTIYIIPSRVIAGRVAILLRTYSKYIVGSAAGCRLNGPQAPGVIRTEPSMDDICASCWDRPGLRRQASI